MEQSRLANLGFLQQGMLHQDEIPHNHCLCFHCLNNTKPLLRPRAPRIQSSKEKAVLDCQALQFIVKQLASGHFSGKMMVPDIFFVQQSVLAYMSRTTGRIKLKEGQTNMDVKKHFDEQRRRTLSNFTQQFLVNSIFISMGDSLPSLAGNPKLPKQAAVLAYSDGAEQILADTMLTKILEKRKNDSSWDEVSHIFLLPPELKHPLQKYKHLYERTNDSIPELTPVLEKISLQIDRTEEGLNRMDNKLNFLKIEEEEQLGDLNPQSKLMRLNSLKLNNKSSIFSRKNHSQKDSIASLMEETSPEEIRLACLEVVAYVELSSHIRLLRANFEFFLQKGKIFLCAIHDCIWEKLDSSQLTRVHDRYKLLDEIELEDITAAKRSYDKSEEQDFWNICGALVKECLQKRKVELKLTDYKKPSHQVLVEIYLKIFPDFKAEKVFENINWQNQLPAFVEQKRKEIAAIIRQDEGIRILRRFGINFKRTFPSNKAHLRGNPNEALLKKLKEQLNEEESTD